MPILCIHIASLPLSLLLFWPTPRHLYVCELVVQVKNFDRMVSIWKSQKKGYITESEDIDQFVIKLVVILFELVEAMSKSSPVR